MSETIAVRLKRPVIIDRELPEIGLVRVRRMTADEMIKFSEMTGREATAWLLQRSVVDESGQPVYTADGDVWATDHWTLDEISKFVLDANRLNVKDAEKNSSTPPSES